MKCLLSINNKIEKIDKYTETDFDSYNDSLNQNTTVDTNTLLTNNIKKNLEHVEINLCEEIEKSSLKNLKKSDTSLCSFNDITTNVNNNNELNSIGVTNHSNFQINQCETPSKPIDSSEKCATPKTHQTSFNNLQFNSQHVSDL